MNINAVFEGGGVKGIAFAGAVQAAESSGVVFNQLAGTSSGSIVASLLAAGYNAAELKQIIEATPFSSLLTRSPIFNTKWFGPATRLFFKKGMYSGEALEYWIHQLLLAKGIRTFRDLPKEKLRIIASDISNRKLLVLPDDIAQYGIDPAALSVSRAVRMSTAIPYFFDPVIIRTAAESRKPGTSFAEQFVHIVDGGLLSNFPLWIFDKENEKPSATVVPSIGFRLVGRGTYTPNTIFGPLSMFKALFTTMMDAHDERYIEEHSRFRTIKIPTLGVSATDFELSDETSAKLYESGLLSAEKFFAKWRPAAYHTQYASLRRRA